MFKTREIIHDFRNETVMSIRKKHTVTRNRIDRPKSKSFISIGEYVQHSDKTVIRVQNAKSIG